jgi:predicted RNA-binding Zn-ribbon protein involved in translation (DUF1610 family)
MKVTVSVSDILDGNQGICLACNELTDGVEPDARNYTCPSCGAREVYGLETALLMDKVEVEDGSDY